MLKQQMHPIDFLDQQIEEFEQRILEDMRPFEDKLEGLDRIVSWGPHANRPRSTPCRSATPVLMRSSRSDHTAMPATTRGTTPVPWLTPTRMQPWTRSATPVLPSMRTRMQPWTGGPTQALADAMAG